jgi:hypothetical protein
MIHHVTPWGIYWLAWFFLGFLAPELYWVFVNARNTLSEDFWGWEDLNQAHPFDFADWTWLHYAFGIIFAIGLFWLFFHLIFGLWH